MADHEKLQKHIAMAGKAAKAGDYKGAAHHMGHAMGACRACAMPGVPTKAKPKPRPVAEKPISPSRARNILARFRKTGGT